MRFNVDRICELAGLGAASGGLISEAAAVAPPAKPAAPAAGAKAAPVFATKKTPPAATEMYSEEEEDDQEQMDEYDDMYGMSDFGDEFDDDVIYDIDETELMEALVTMRQQRLEESSVRDTVRDEIRRALSDKSGSWVYGSNKPAASRMGQISRGGFGVGFGFRK